MRSVVPGLLLLVACQTPAEAPPEAPAEGAAPAEGTPAAPEGAPPQGPPQGAPPVGAAPVEGAPPAEGAPPVGAAPAEGAAPPVDPTPPSLAADPGQGVKVGGTVTYDGVLTAPIRIDFLQADDKAPPGSPGRVVHTTQIAKAGPWSQEIRKDAGTVQVSVYIDVDGNGPSTTEPQATIPNVNIAAAPVTNLDATLSDPPGMQPPAPGTVGPAVDALGGKKGGDPNNIQKK